MLTYAEYDPATDAVVRTVADADTGGGAAFAGYDAAALAALGLATPAGAGTHLESTAEVDARGRVTASVGPDGVATYAVYHDNGAIFPANVGDYHPIHQAIESARVYPAWDAAAGRPAGPSLYVTEASQGRYAEAGAYTDAPELLGGRPTGGEAIESFASLSRSYVDVQGRPLRDDSYFDLTGLDPRIDGPGDELPATLGARDANFHRAEYRHDARGRLDRVVDWSGTAYTTAYDTLGRPAEQRVGLPGDDGVVTARYEWDHGGPGDSLLTRLHLPDGDGGGRDARFFHDWRGRAVLAAVGVTGGDDADGAVGITYETRDNLGRLTATEHHAVAGVDLSADFAQRFDADANGAPDRPGDGGQYRRARTEFSLDSLGRAYRVDGRVVDRGTGVLLAGGLWSQVVRDRRGLPVKTWGSGGPVAAKVAYDSLGRPTSTYAVDASGDQGYGDAFTVLGNAVYEQVDYHYDDADGGGRVERVSSWQRHHDAPPAATGGLAGTGHARPDHAALYYDAAGRPTDTVRFGTNGGEPFARPAAVPPRGTDFDYDALVSSVAYGVDGRAERTTDPRGNADLRRHDLLGRPTRLTESFGGDGSPAAAAPDRNRVTTYRHGPAGVTAVTARLPGDRVQETAYLYGTRLADGHGLDANNLPSAVHYPDPATGWASAAHAETWVVNRLGETVRATDRNGTTHAYGYDDLGRLVADEVTALGPGVDPLVARIALDYDDAGLGSLRAATSLDADGGVLNQVLREYDDLGRLSAEHQSHGGAVAPGTSPAIGYQYAPLTAGADRLAGLVYPDGRVVGREYDALGRLSALTDGPAGSPALETYAYLGLGTAVERHRPEPGHAWTLAGAPGSSDSGDAYRGLDRFGRLAEHRWARDAGGDLQAHAYGYDPNGNRLHERDLTGGGGGTGELYHDGGGYDALDRMTSFARGTLADNDGDGTYDAIQGPVGRSQTWQLDALGNWDGVTTDGQQQARDHDAQNRIESVGTVDLDHSPNGEMTLDEQGQTLAWDAWGRLVRVEDEQGAVVGTYAYDALGRRVVENDAQLIYTAAWQVAEERDAQAGQTRAQYVWGPAYVDAMVLRDADTDGDGDVRDGGGSTRHYAVHDANFDVTLVTDAGGNVAERYEYDPYGARTVLTPGGVPAQGNASQLQVPWVHGHQGLRLDAAAGLYDSRMRPYDPDLGRFASADPLGYADGMNRRQAYGGAPAGVLDPSGLFGIARPGGGGQTPVDLPALVGGDHGGFYAEFDAGGVRRGIADAHDAIRPGSGEEDRRKAGRADAITDGIDVTADAAGDIAGIVGDAVGDEAKDVTNYIPGGAVAKGVAATAGVLATILRSLPDAAESTRDVLKRVAIERERARKAMDAAEAAQKAEDFQPRSAMDVVNDAMRSRKAAHSPSVAAAKLQKRVQAEGSTIWGKPASGSLVDQNKWAGQHLHDILTTEGIDWIPMLNPRTRLGVHMRKFLPDGRGVAVDLDGNFVTFLNGN